MRRLPLASLAAAALIAALLGGCATPVERPDPVMSWGVYDSPGEGAKLVLGEPETDYVRLMMVCRPHSGEVDVTIIGRLGDPAAVELRSGEVSHLYAGAGQADDETDGAFDIYLKAKTADPVLMRLADTGELTVVFPDRRIVLPNAFSPAHDFLAICRPL